MAAVRPTEPTSSLAALFNLETSFQTIDQRYQAYKTRLNLSCEENDAAQCQRAAQLNASLQVIIANMMAVLQGRTDADSETQQLRLERKRTALKDDYTTLTASLKDAQTTTGMYQARYICYTAGFLFVLGLCLRA